MPYNAPRDATLSVLRRLGIDPAARVSEADQDAEYTSCRSDEIPLYFDLYRHGELEQAERAVLCCFMLEGLNELTQSGEPHVLQDKILDTLLESQEHQGEIGYWTDMSDPDPSTWWPIAVAIRTRALARINRAVP